MTGRKFDKFTLFKRLAAKSLANEQISQRLVTTNLDDFLVWQIADDSPNSPNFPAIWYITTAIYVAMSGQV